MKKIQIVLLLLFTGLSSIYSQTASRNYFLTHTCTNDAGSAFLDEVQYLDGLGRPVETVQKSITPAKADLISFQEYDAYGRESNAWLPAIASGNNGVYMTLDNFKIKSGATYNNTVYNAVVDANPYSYPVYETSPLNRILKQFGPGADWQISGKAVEKAYKTNISGDATLNCKYYLAGGTNQNPVLSQSGNYATGQLYVTETKDEDGNLSYEFKDKLGQVVLTRQILNGTGLDTYAVYSDFGNLCFVLPPRIQDEGTAQDKLNTLAYQYKYDSRNRCIVKKLPGCDQVACAYDIADHLIFTQDGENYKKNEWQFSIPDVFGRIVLAGTCKNTFNYTANPFNTVLIKGTYNISRSNLANSYTVSGVSLSNPVYLTANYYDDYGFQGITEAPNNGDSQYNPEPGFDTRYTASYKGMLTGTVNAQLNPDGTVSSTYLYSMMYYDYRNRLIQVKGNNPLPGGLEKDYTAYDFMNNPVNKKHIHSATGKGTYTENYVYSYDHAERLIKTTHQFNGGTTATIAENAYDELGRLKTNKKGGLANLNTTYAYNIRSWVKSISNPLFAENLYYNESYGSSVKLYNGNLSAMNWKLSSETNTRGYAFSYDNLSRLTTGNYLENGAANNNFKTAYTYDKQGNIKTLQRYGKMTATSYGLIDNLTLDYSGNQLLKVEDAVPTISLAESADFKNYSNTATEYVYNANGAMTKDLNKGISDIQYNLLNLPRLSDIKSPVAEARNEYTYSASGQKLKVVQKWNPNYSTTPVIGSAVNVSFLTMSKTTDYIGSMIYENGSLKRVLIDGGFFEGGQYHYYMTDHQGNNRLVVNADNYLEQKIHYYPFGMAYAETPIADQSLQSYKYNGKELDQMSGLNQYDYSARYYDPALAQFTTVDPMAEKYYSVSPYAYCANNPVRFVDPTGLDWYWDNDKTRQYNPDLNKDNQADILKKGQTYIGATAQVTDKKGNVTEDYRADGSIMYSNEASGYRRMWNNTQKTGKEEMGVITDNGVLVLPSWNNKITESEVEDYGYAFDKGNLIDPVSDKKLSFSGTIHTHPTYTTDQQGNVVHSWMKSSREDFDYFGRETPNIPFYVITADGRIHSNIPRNANLATPLILGNAGQTIGGIVFRHYSLKNRGQ